MTQVSLIYKPLLYRKLVDSIFLFYFVQNLLGYFWNYDI